jgi:hypothetical protein
MRIANRKFLYETYAMQRLVCIAGEGGLDSVPFLKHIG